MLIITSERASKGDVVASRSMTFDDADASVCGCLLLVDRWCEDEAGDDDDEDEEDRRRWRWVGDEEVSDDDDDACMLIDDSFSDELDDDDDDEDKDNEENVEAEIGWFEVALNNDEVADAADDDLNVTEMWADCVDKNVDDEGVVVVALTVLVDLLFRLDDDFFVGYFRHVLLQLISIWLLLLLLALLFST